MWQALGQDLRYAIRRLAHNPGFTLLVALIPALRIGANSAMYSMVDAALLRTLPFPRSRPHWGVEARVTGDWR